MRKHFIKPCVGAAFFNIFTYLGYLLGATNVENMHHTSSVNIFAYFEDFEFVRPTNISLLWLSGRQPVEASPE